MSPSARYVDNAVAVKGPAAPTTLTVRPGASHAAAGHAPHAASAAAAAASAASQFLLLPQREQKLTSDARCLAAINDTVWVGQRDGTVHIYDMQVASSVCCAC